MAGGGIGPWCINKEFSGFVVFISKKCMKVRIFGGNDYYGVCRWIENKILPHFDVLMLEIGLLDIEKIK